MAFDCVQPNNITQQQHMAASRGRKHQRGGGGCSSIADNSADFHAAFGQQFLQRWPSLLEALAQPLQLAALLNAFATVDDCSELGMARWWQQQRSPHLRLMRFPEPHSSYPPPPLCPYTQLRQFLCLDASALLPPLLLGVRPHHVVLDMCAAPGGMALVLAQQLLKGEALENSAQPESSGLTEGLLQQLALDEQEEEEGQQEGGEHNSSDGSQPGAAAEAAGARAKMASSPAAGRLVCNESDQGRRGRLQQLLAQHLPPSLRRRVRVTGHDAAQHWSRHEAGLFDAVLLAAPCSAERHVVAAAVAGGGRVAASAWSRERCQQLAALQLKLLLAGLRALKPGGRLAYTTGSLAAAENDGVVEAALRAINSKLKPSASLQQQKQQQQPPGPLAADGSGGECGALAAAPSAAAAVVRPVPVAEWCWDDELRRLLGGGEATQHGLMLLPDAGGWGPTYVALLERVRVHT